MTKTIPRHSDWVAGPSPRPGGRYRRARAAQAYAEIRTGVTHAPESAHIRARLRARSIRDKTRLGLLFQPCLKARAWRKSRARFASRGCGLAGFACAQALQHMRDLRARCGVCRAQGRAHAQPRGLAGLRRQH